MNESTGGRKEREGVNSLRAYAARIKAEQHPGSERVN